MFTGIVERTGTISQIEDIERGRRLVLDVGDMTSELSVGDSVAVNGTCLTAVAIDGDLVALEVVGETLDRTNLRRLAEGDHVNLERPMAASGRFDGHIVQGHIDDQGVVRSVMTDGESSRLWVDTPAPILRFVVEKGSITVDGVSLTVASVDEAGFEIALIPHTLEVTTLGSRRVGDPVNLEVDVLAKYVERLLGTSP
jgi:riboflavin synthase